MEFFGLIHKRPGYDPFFAENPFSPADELVFMGLVAAGEDTMAGVPTGSMMSSLKVEYHGAAALSATQEKKVISKHGSEHCET